VSDLNRERELDDAGNTVLAQVEDHYRKALSFRVARYDAGRTVERILDTFADERIRDDDTTPYSSTLCYLVAAIYQDARAISNQKGATPAAQHAYLLEQEWITRASWRSDRRSKQFTSAARVIWRLTSKYGTSGTRFAGTVLLIILFYAVLYFPCPSFIDDSAPKAFRVVIHDSGRQEHTTSAAAADALYLSVVVISTLGLGDLLPLNTFGRLIVASEAIIGVSLFGILVSLFTASLRIAESPPSTPSRNDANCEKR
jgi:hypothetical protein